MLEEQQGLYDWPFQVEELLFKRARRPDSLPLTLALLERLQAAPGLRPHQRVYAGIALAYAALQADDTRRLQELRPWLEVVASLEAKDEPAGVSGGPATGRVGSSSASRRAAACSNAPWRPPLPTGPVSLRSVTPACGP